MQLRRYWSAHATVGYREQRCRAAQARAQPQPETDCWSGCSPPFVRFPPTAKSPEESSQKCAAGRDAVQIARLQEVVSKSRNSPHVVPQHEFDGVGAYGDGASATPY